MLGKGEQVADKPAAPEVLRAVHAKTEDVRVSADPQNGPTETLVKRKFRNYRVEPVGKNADKLPTKIVENCVDESDAKQVYYVAIGRGESTGKYPVKVTPAA